MQVRDGVRHSEVDSSNVCELGLLSLIYISRSALAVHGDADAVNEIIRLSEIRNGSLRVTGRLIYTELHFAQLLEGPACAIAELMRSIRRDERHRDVSIVAEQRIAARKWKDWAMSYSGASPYLDRHLKPLISPATAEEERPPLVERLMSVMQKLDAEPMYTTSR